MRITYNQLQKLIEEETRALVQEMIPTGYDRRDIVAMSELPPNEQSSEELHQQFTEVCKGDVVLQYCKDVHAELESRKPPLPDPDAIVERIVRKLLKR